MAIDPTIDQDQFAQACLDAARTYGTNAHYLIAVAFIESGIKNIGAPGSSAFGPFQILEETWANYVADGAMGFSRDDRVDPMAQPYVAAKIAATACQTLMAVLPDKRLPTAAELYFSHLFGEHGAEVILSGDRTRSVRDALVQVYSPGANAEAHADKIIAANKPLLTENDKPRSVDSLLQVVGTRLDKGLAVAVPLIKGIEPDLFSGPSAAASNDGAVPWMVVAKKELANGVVEGNPRIKEYFTATTYDPPPGHVAWCAAFVAFCIMTCGDSTKKQKRSARAEDWLSVGTPLPGPQYGAIAVLEPLVADSSGHVGFVVSWNADKLQLLAGNQTPPGGAAHAVCVKDFKITSVRGWRMV